MRTQSRRLARILTLTSLFVLAVAPSADARTLVDPNTLTPPPPDFSNATCYAQGRGITCDLAFSDPTIVDEPGGIVCGGIELRYSQHRAVVGKRFYDADGDLLRRHFREDMRGTLDHPITGASLDFTQSNTILHDLGTPGVVTSGVSRIVGQGFKVTEPDGRAVIVDAGWVAIDASVGEIIDWAGPHRLDDYFVRGDADALDAVCDAIG